MEREELIKKFCEIVIHVGLSEDTEPTIEGIVKELRRTNCDGCKSFAGELESLSFAADSLTPAVKESLTVEPMTAEEFIREKIRQKFELKGDMMGLWCYSLNGEDALRWAHEYASKPTVAEREAGDRMGIDEIVTPDEFRKARNKIQRT